MRFLAQANDICEWMWRVYFKYIVASIAGVAITCLFSVLYCYIIRRDLNADNFYRPVRLVYDVEISVKHCATTLNDLNFYFIYISLPWNQMTDAGYVGEVCYSIGIGYAFLLINGTPLLFFISVCIHHQAFRKMFTAFIGNADQCDEKTVCELIRFHTTTKEYVKSKCHQFGTITLDHQQSFLHLHLSVCSNIRPLSTVHSFWFN